MLSPYINGIIDNKRSIIYKHYLIDDVHAPKAIYEEDTMNAKLIMKKSSY